MTNQLRTMGVPPSKKSFRATMRAQINSKSARKVIKKLLDVGPLHRVFLGHSNWVQANEDKRLDRNISALPQELQDMVLDFTLAAALPEKKTICIVDGHYHLDATTQDDPAGVVLISPAYPLYKPPTALHINRKIRARFAESYYADTTFFIPETLTLRRPYYVEGPAYISFKKFVTSLTLEHRRMIGTVKHTLEEPAYTKDDSFFVRPFSLEYFASAMVLNATGILPQYPRLQNRLWDVALTKFAFLGIKKLDGQKQMVWHRLDGTIVP